MRAIVCRAPGAPESLELTDWPVPEPGPGQVQIAVRAAALNFADTLVIRHKYQIKPEFPFIPGSECAGIVSAVGPGVTQFRPGDRVMGYHFFGCYAETAVVDETACFSVPETMPWDVAAGFCVTFGSVYHGLIDRGELKPGETVLIHGAAGGAGLNAVEIAKLAGARVIASAGSADKVALALAHGADEGIDYARENIRDRVKALTDDRGADVVFDPVGGDAFDQSLRCIAWGGRLLVYGFASGRIPQIPANHLLVKGCAAIGVEWVRFARYTPDRNRANLGQLCAWYTEGKLQPIVSARYPLAEAAAALNFLAERKSTGKVVLTMGD